MITKTSLVAVTIFSSAAALILNSAIAAPAGLSSYALQQQFSLGAPTKWDYADIDSVRHRLYLSRGDHVQVLDLPSGQQVANIANTKGVHGIAFAQDLKLGFTSNGASNSVTVFDLDTMQTKAEIKLSGINPDAIFYEPASHKLFTFNGKSKDVSVIDAIKLTEIASIKVTGKPEFAVSDGAGKIYLNIEDNAGINVIDVASNTLVSKWPLSGCEEPTGMAIDTVNARLFSTCQNKIMAVTDAKTGKRVVDVAIGEHPDAAIFDAETATIFTSNGGGTGTLTVIHQDDANHYSVVANVPTNKGARTMAMDHSSNTIYLPTIMNNMFTVLVVSKK
ncbi:YVTN family beta-propeller protein [Undibacterium sp. GrIS 1.8]|uniref:YncE family protein n=1 Tax=Undibacterium sp. GrIS 1.8 TaxID=3143934 RepID=UPI0033917C31